MKRLLLTAALCGIALPAVATPLPVTVPSLLQNVQSDQSFRVNQLEEQVRQLNGRVEDLNFLLLQLQEDLRRMQQDNELRFQELEDRQGSAPGDTSRDVAEGGSTDRLEKPEAASEQDAAETEAEADNPNLGTPPRALGTLQFDAEGNVIDSAPADQAEDALSQLDAPFGEGSPGAVDASQFGATPREVMTVAQQALFARDYPKAETAFRAALAAWPDDPQAGAMGAGLGETLFWQKKYYPAAQAHLQAHRDFPEAATAPENLLGLALSLAGLNQREVACATYAEVLKQYPEAEPRLGERIKDEQAAARC
ncbi:MAG: tol-pal system protein YbgF [Pseudomonadota bacterium]